MPFYRGQHVSLILLVPDRRSVAVRMFTPRLKRPRTIVIVAILSWLMVTGYPMAADLSADGIPYDHGMPPVVSSIERGAGERLYTDKGCVQCHGPRGFSGDPDMFPRIAGLQREYIIDQLNAFRSGKRANVIMSPVAETLTPDDIAALAAFISGKP